MNIRYPIRAGSFYECAQGPCRHHAEKLVDSADVPGDVPGAIFGGIVPHAGWSFSGRLAARTFKALSRAGRLGTVVLLGADHVGAVHVGEVFDSGLWRTPLGEAPVDSELARELVAAGEMLQPNPEAHALEHSIEVQIPLLQVLAPDVQIVPIAVPPTDLAVEIGRTVGEVVSRHGGNVCVVGSTDLTHHGGHFPAPGGKGKEGVEWAGANDRRMIDLIEAMRDESVIGEANQRGNACGAGAIAATIAACKVMGASRGICLEYTNSYDVIHATCPDEPDDTTVGYVSIVFA